MSENIQMILIAVFGILLMILIAILFIKIMINTTKSAKNKQQ